VKELSAPALASSLGVTPLPPVLSPAGDLGPQPQEWTVWSEIDHWSGHVGVSALVETHAVRLGKAKDLGDAPCVDEVFNPNELAHQDESIHVDSVTPMC
jgi:hypothetical protein